MIASAGPHLVVLGAGVVGCLGAPAVAEALAQVHPRGAVRVSVMDRARLDATYLRAGDIYDGRPGEGKAAALARRLRERGLAARALHGNVRRWPHEAFSATLGLVGLDREDARLAACRRLRQAGVPALVVGIADEVAVQVLGPHPEDACRLCPGPDSIALASTPCIPAAPGPSTRERSAPRARALLGEILGELAREVLAGTGFGRAHVLDPERGRMEARILRSPRCLEDHGAVAPRGPTLDLDARMPLAESFALAAAELARAGAGVGGRMVLEQAGLRLRYRCPACGRRSAHGGGLIRSWPARERCPCGSPEVWPTLRLDGIDEPGAAQEGLLGASLGDLGLPPGARCVFSRGASSLSCRVRAPVADAEPRILPW